MDLKELIKTLEQRREGLAYKLWKEAMLTGLACNNGKSYPKDFKEACPELFPPKKRIKMPKWMKERMLKKGGVK